MSSSIHIARKLIATAFVLIALVVVGAVIDGALGTIVLLLELGLILAVVPLVVIHYDEHEERLHYRRPGEP